MNRSIFVLTAVLGLALAVPAAAHDRRPHLGTAVDMQALADEPDYRSVVAREFTSVTAENVMKWESVEPARGIYDSRRPTHSSLTPSATARSSAGTRWSGTTSCRLAHRRATAPPPSSRRSCRGTSSTRPGTSRAHLAWDVVNEAFNDDGTLRDTIWYSTLGPGYIADAFRWAHRPTRKAKLYFNDYNIEGDGPKSDAVYALVSACAARACRSTASASRATSASSTASRA